MDKQRYYTKIKDFEIQYFQKISYTIALFDCNYEFKMISAFIWYAYCPYKWKIIIFRKSASQKLKNVSVINLGYYNINYNVGTNIYKKPGKLDYIWVLLGTIINTGTNKLYKKGNN